MSKRSVVVESGVVALLAGGLITLFGVAEPRPAVAGFFYWSLIWLGTFLHLTNRFTALKTEDRMSALLVLPSALLWCANMISAVILVATKQVGLIGGEETTAAIVGFAVSLLSMVGGYFILNMKL